ncbi:low molecular weight protein-tyrosine-phosphatase [Vibrio navarrensis]|uniref:low molecular weight protein-tyrosine-phosphatase n=1 Tax=Vibrio navarrensis TaxID=29495 RepID=UPI00051DEDA3|nr:low molecular weight protein-tyrosine-phosphatase [Vibrio navarrensis]KGK09775.1 protein tyrosine phosphatase [Vibrio navarrensis]
MKKLLVVCMGNICRSPTAEAVLRAKAMNLGMEVEIDSAGTIDYHSGSQPDHRSRRAGEKRGYSFQGIRARQVRAEDFAYFDMVFAADKANLHDLFAICPAQYQHKISLFLSHCSCEHDEISDPYYGGDAGFEQVLDLIEQAADAILEKCKN